VKSKKAELFLSSKFFLYAKGQKNEKKNPKITQILPPFWLII
jgi:hypothetical protein